MNTTLKELQDIENDQKRWDKFVATIVYEMNENKEEIKGQKLSNGMSITGIGKKCLKIENNFYAWEDIENVASGVEENDDPIMKNILAYLFEDYEPATVSTDEYTPRKFTRTEAINEFHEIKNEIIENKKYYKQGKIAGIGDKAILLTAPMGYDNEYVYWEEIEKEIKKYPLLSDITMNAFSFEEQCCVEVINELFIDDEEETSVEKRLREKGDNLADEKSYVYRHILYDDLTVEQIRRIVRIQHGTNDNYEEIITELLQFAFKYTKEVKFTDKDYDEEDRNTYAIKNGKGYAYIIKNKKIEYKGKTAQFKDIPQVKIKADGFVVEVQRNEEKPRRITAGHHDIYIAKNKKIAYVFTKEQQIELLSRAGEIQEVDEQDIKNNFIKLCESENEAGQELAETIHENYDSIEEAYTKSTAVKAFAKTAYKAGRQESRMFYECLNAITSEKHINPQNIQDLIIWDDGNSHYKAELLENKYHFQGDESGKTIRIGTIFGKEYLFVQNCEYTKITVTESYIDSFSVEDVYIKGDIDEEDIPYYWEYANGMYLMQNELKYGYLYEKDHLKIKF